MLWSSVEDVLFGEYMGDRLERLSKEEGKRNTRSHGGVLLCYMTTPLFRVEISDLEQLSDLPGAHR